MPGGGMGGMPGGDMGGMPGGDMGGAPGGGGSGMPANKAAKLNPIDALRDGGRIRIITAQAK